MAVTNPNNWHWVDKNCLPWAREYFEHKLVGLQAGDVTVTKVKSLEGDCEVCQRKGKVISLYDMCLVVEYTSDGRTGTITVPEVMYDTEPDEYQFNLGERVEEKDRVAIRGELVPQLREVLADFGPTLIHVHGSDIQVDESEVMSTFTKGNQNLIKHMKPVVKERTTLNKAPAAAAAKPLSAYSKGYNVTTLELHEEFNTTAEELYKTLTDPQRYLQFTRTPAEGLEPREGCEFRVFGGGVECKLLKLDPYRRIDMLWRLSSWKQGHYVQIRFSFNQGQSETTMDVVLDGVPVGEEDLVLNNFKERYIRAIKVTFGFGAVL